jgi:hypothetical protein
MKTILNPPIVNTLQLIEEFHGSIRSSFGEIRPLHFELKKAKIAKIKEVVHQLLIDSNLLSSLIMDTEDAKINSHDALHQDVLANVKDSKSLLSIFDSILFQIKVAVTCLHNETESFELIQFRLFQISFVYGRLFEISDMLFHI